MHHILGIFDDVDAARRACERLGDAGVARSAMHLQPGTGAAFLAQMGPSQPAPGDPDYRPQGILQSFASFWANLLESHTDESGIYSDRLRAASASLLVEVEGFAAAERARRLLGEFGAIHVGERRETVPPSRGAGAGAGAAAEAGERDRMSERAVASEAPDAAQRPANPRERR